MTYFRQIDDVIIFFGMASLPISSNATFSRHDAVECQTKAEFGVVSAVVTIAGDGTVCSWPLPLAFHQAGTIDGGFVRRRRL